MNVVTRRNDSPLGPWTYSEWRPAHLARVVKLLWQFDGPSVNRYKRILPNGTVELLVNFGDPYRVVAQGMTRFLRSAWLGGVRAAPSVVEQPARQNVLGVRLHPAGAYALLGLRMEEMGALAVDLEDLVGPMAAELRERCHELAAVEERFRLVAGWIAERVARSRGVERPIAWSAEQIERSGGAVSITDLRTEIGLSKTRLVEAFREQIGVAPKLYARIVRFHRVTEMLQGGARQLADVALAAGYYDQPHMNAEFRALSGLSPREFLAGRHPVGDGSTVGDPSSEQAGVVVRSARLRMTG